MTIDEHGLIWLANPWVAAAFFTTVLGLVLWSHRAIEASARPRMMAVRIRRPRRARQLGAAAADISATPTAPIPARGVPPLASRRPTPTAPLAHRSAAARRSTAVRKAA